MINTKNGNLFIIAAPSGAGKTSLVKAITTRLSNIHTSVSHTTRPPRTGEIDGKDYHFVGTNDFFKMRDNNDFLEYAKVFDNYYGTSKHALQKQLNNDNDVILEIDWQGAQQVKKIFSDAVSIFILPPSRATLLERLRNRGQDSEDVISRRTQEAITEMSHYNEFDYLIVNDNFDTAETELYSIISTQRLKTAAQKNRIQTILDELLE